jgi:hypothetical protein
MFLISCAEFTYTSLKIVAVRHFYRLNNNSAKGSGIHTADPQDSSAWQPKENYQSFAMSLLHSAESGVWNDRSSGLTTGEKTSTLVKKRKPVEIWEIEATRICRLLPTRLRRYYEYVHRPAPHQNQDPLLTLWYLLNNWNKKKNKVALMFNKTQGIKTYGE